MSTRRDFMQAMAGAAVSAAAGKLVSANAAQLVSGPATKANIKRGVTICYSYSRELRSKQLSFEDAIAEASDLGAYGIELLPETVVPNFPNPPDSFIAQWFAWMDEYKTVPVTYTQFLDANITKDRNYTLSESLEKMELDLKLARRMGFSVMRVLPGVLPAVLEKSLPLAEKYDVCLAPEIHAPMTLDGPLVNKWIEIIERTKTRHMKLNPDFNIFQYRPRLSQREAPLKAGNLTEALVLYVEQSKASGTPREAVKTEVTRRGGKPGDLSYVDLYYGIKMEDPKLLVPMLKHVLTCHAKVWDMREDMTDASIAYDKVIPVLIQAGWSGYLITEYEGTGNIGSDGLLTNQIEEVRRQQLMLKRMLGEA